jgi:peptidyl-prolyl cis-trans isomerase SurA
MMRTFALAVLLAATGLAGLDAAPAAAASQRVVAVVDDQPITDYDVDQRIKLYEALGMRRTADRKAVLKELVDDAVKRTEAKRNKVDVTDKQMQESLERLSKGSGTDVKGLEAKLRERGVAFSTLKEFVESSIITRWLLGRQGDVQVQVNDAEVQRRVATITSDPRLKPVVVYEIQQIELPIEKGAEAMAQQLLYARAVEAQQMVQRYKGCGSLRKAAEGIFNVKIGQPVQAAADKMPPEMKQALEDAGTKRLIGPMPGPTGVRMIAFCGRKNVAPPLPPKDQLEAFARNQIEEERFKVMMDRVLRDLRRRSFIDYKDASLQ